MGNPRTLLVLYATQTGTAQEVAESIVRQARARAFHVQLASMDEYDRALLVQESWVIFVCSTTGQGEEPDSMKVCTMAPNRMWLSRLTSRENQSFWRFLLRKNWPEDILSGLEFAVFGLGDSSYAKFNFPAKKLHKRLLQLGAKAVVPRGDGDDQHYLGLDGGLEPWLENLWSVVLKKWPLPPGVTVRSESELAPPSFNISIADEDYQEMNGIKLHSASKSQKEFRAQVLENIRLTAQEHFQDIRHLELRISDPSSSTQEARIYETGDVLVVRPLNDPEKVDQFLDLVGWTDIADKKLRVEPSHSDFALPSHCHSSSPHTLRSLCIQYLDICGKPKRYFFHLISHFCESEEHKERLQELSSSQGQQDLFRYAYSTKRTLLEVLMDFPLKGKIPLTYVLDLIPWIRPRSFSIASSPEIDPWRIGLTVGIVEYTVPGMKSLRTGVCTQWMKRLEVGDEFNFTITKETLRLPPSPSTPIILIGPGTGIAPMRALLQTRIRQGARENALFVGCRFSSKDYIYRGEWECHQSAGYLILKPSFSRETSADGRKEYVQNTLLKEKEWVWRWIRDQGAYIYISGNTEVPIGVRESLVQMAQDMEGWTLDEAEKFVKSQLENTRRLQSETWSKVDDYLQLIKKTIP